MSMTYPSKQDKDLLTKLNHYEQVLSNNRYLNGEQLTSLDKDFYTALQPHGGKINPVSHPYVWGHFCFMYRLNPQLKDKLPVVEDPQAAKAAAAKKDADELDDLFGDDDGDD
jgi:hypothetical protein